MEDKIEKYKELKEKASKLKTKKITLEAQYKTKKESLKEAVTEVKDKGYDPNKLSQIIKEKEALLLSELDSFEKEIEEVSNKLSEIEG